MKKYFFFLLFIITVLAVLPAANAQSLIDTACEEPPDYTGGPIYRLICNGNTIVTEQCNTVEDCHALYSKEYRQCQDGAYECARKCEKERSDSCSRSNGAPGCGDVLNACSSACSKVNVQCYKMVRDNAEKCKKKRHWEKSNIANGRVCDTNTPCVQICDADTQCVQNGDYARCVRSSEKPQIPSQTTLVPSEVTTPSPAYFRYKEVNRILDAVPLPEIPDNVTYEQCNRLCSNLDDQGYHGQLIKACEENKSYLEQIYGYSECSTVAYQRMSACWSDSCGLMRILVGPTDGSRGAILRLDEIEKTTKIPLDGLINKRPEITEQQFEEIRVSEDETQVPSGDFKAYAWTAEGDTDIQLPGSDEWIPLKKGDPLPEGTKIFTGMDSDLLVHIRGVGVVKVRPFSELTLTKLSYEEALKPESHSPIILHLDLRNGEVEVHVERGTYQSSMQVKMPGSVAGVRGTHFWLRVTDEGHSILGVYKGEVLFASLLTGEEKTVISSGDKPQIAAMRFVTGVELEKVTEKNSRVLLLILMVMVLGGGVFILHKKGKLQPIIQKVLSLVRRDKSKSL